MSMSMTLSEELAWRGFINQTTFTDLKELDAKTWTFYHGFDASADSQTIGNLAAMMFDKVFLRHGHKAVLLAGGATSLIGDPGGKDKERVLQDETTIAHNVARAEDQLKVVFKGYDFTLVNNLDWYKGMNVMQFLRDVGKHFSMTPLVQRDYIAKRMGEGGVGISYTEFSYTILQGFDFWHLYKEHGVELQLAGSDQWGNSLSGVDYIRRTEGKETHVITCALVINKATGVKFGKSEEGAVWLDAAKTSPYKFYQFWLNIGDEGVEDYLKIYTELDKPKIDDTMQKFATDRASRLAQKTLAYEVTKLIHGQKAADTQVNIAEALFSGGPLNLGPDEYQALEAELPVAQVPKNMAQGDLLEALVATKLASSKTEARRFLQSGAIYINNIQIESGDGIIYDASDNHAVIRRGKNTQAILKIN
jgi:tyrosyl-tRNA synthetase